MTRCVPSISEELGWSHTTGETWREVEGSEEGGGEETTKDSLQTGCRIFIDSESLFNHRQLHHDPSGRCENICVTLNRCRFYASHIHLECPRNLGL